MRFLVLASLFLSFSVSAEDPLRLPIGDSARREREAAVVLDAITDTARGDLITPLELPARLSGVRLLLTGESHTDMDSHRVQMRVLEGLHAAGRKVAIGLEMLPAETQGLDAWMGGGISEEKFLQASGWYRHWGYNWGYYRDIFLFARDKKIPLVGVNAPREAIALVRRKGFEGLSEEERKGLPLSVDTESAEHLRLFKASFEDAGFHASMTEEQWKGLFAAQCAWDAAMAWHAVGALEKMGGESAILILLAGAGHVQYGLGIQRQAAKFFKGKIATLLPVAVADDKGRPVKGVRASYADFLWGVPAEADPLYPNLGISTRTREEEKRLEIIHVEKDSPAEKAGLQTGDVLLALDGAEVRDRETLNRLLAAKNWGDAAGFSVKRKGEVLAVPVIFRRTKVTAKEARPVS